MDKQLNFKIYRAVNDSELEKLQSEYYSNRKDFFELMAWAANSDFVEIARVIIPDKRSPWSAPVICMISEHPSTIGAKNLTQKANDFFQSEQKKIPFDVLSLSAGMENDALVLKSLIRVYSGIPDIKKFFEYLGSEMIKQEAPKTVVKGRLVIPDELKNFKITEEEQVAHDADYLEQEKVLENSSEAHPFLNSIDKYVPKNIPNPYDSTPLVYDLVTKDMSVKTVTQYEQFINVFNQVMTYVSGVEYYNYFNVLTGDATEESFMAYLETYIRDNFVGCNQLAAEDVPVMLDKVYTALFRFYVIQDLIDDPDVTDIEITAYNSIRARIKGKAYKSNINFVDYNDYIRFLNGICIRNGIPQDVPNIRFADDHDENYRLRFSISSEYVNSESTPYMHIRKLPKKKMMANDLMAAGMFDEKIYNYLLDCGRHSKGVIFAGPPGSGKTYALNWFLEEAYEQSAEMLAIQETDELFAYREGVMFQHVVIYPQKGKPAISLEELGQNALVQGANVFIIGEAKGAEICSAITISNSGCRTAMTIHAESAKQVPDKMVDLAMRGYTTSAKQTKRMLTCFQTIVYLENFCVKEIVEITGYDDNKEDLTYRYIYKKDAKRRVA